MENRTRIEDEIQKAEQYENSQTDAIASAGGSASSAENRHPCCGIVWRLIQGDNAHQAGIRNCQYATSPLLPDFPMPSEGHISSRHGLSRDEYLKRWGLQPDHPLTAPAYSEHRSTLAKQLGLGRKPKADEAPASIPAESAVANGDEKVEAADGEVDGTSKPRRTTRSGSKSEVADEAASEPTKPRQRRPRSRVAPPQSEPVPTPTADA